MQLCPGTGQKLGGTTILQNSRRHWTENVPSCNGETIHYVTHPIEQALIKKHETVAENVSPSQKVANHNTQNQLTTSENLEKNKPGTFGATVQQLWACHPKAYWGRFLCSVAGHHCLRVKTEVRHLGIPSFWSYQCLQYPNWRHTTRRCCVQAPYRLYCPRRWTSAEPSPRDPFWKWIGRSSGQQIERLEKPQRWSPYWADVLPHIKLHFQLILASLEIVSIITFTHHQLFERTWDSSGRWLFSVLMRHFFFQRDYRLNPASHSVARFFPQGHNKINTNQNIIRLVFFTSYDTEQSRRRKSWNAMTDELHKELIACASSSRDTPFISFCESFAVYNLICKEISKSCIIKYSTYGLSYLLFAWKK